MATAIQCIERRATSLRLEWQVLDPEGAEVQSCELWVAGAVSWQQFATEPGSEPRRTQGTTWEVTIQGLTAARDYDLRLCGRNIVGAGPWAKQEVRTSELPPEATSFVCQERSPNKLTLEWYLEDPQGAEVNSCELQVAGSLSWASADFRGAGPIRTEGKRWQATVVSLVGDTTYNFRVRGRSAAGDGEWSQLTCKTAERPPVATAFQCVERTATSLRLEWQLPDPEGAEVQSCELEVAGSLSWASAAFSGAGPIRTEGKRWQTTVVSLVGDMTYNFRVRGRSAAGDGDWSQLTCKTAEKPPMAAAIQCVERRATNLRLEWQVSDPEGAEVQSCEIWLVGAVSWQQLATEPGSEPRRTQGTTWEVTIQGLTAAKDYDLRLCGRNVVGAGPWAKQEVRTSELPPEATSFVCLQPTPIGLTLEWHLEDPQGAEVKSCELQVAGSLSWASAAFSRPDAEPCRHQGGVWRASITGLLCDTTYEVRVRGRSEGGDGSWCQRQFHTISGKPDAPFDVTWKCLGPGSLELQWRVHDPAGVPITSCNVRQLIKPSIAAPYWEAAQLEHGKLPWRVEGDSNLWQANVVGLSADTTYTFSVFASNDEGDGRWLRKELCTLRVPEAPSNLDCTGCFHDRLALEWHISDPEGAAVLSCDVQMFGTLFWQPAAVSAAPCRREGEADIWRVTVMGLAENSSYEFRVCGHNAVGEGEWSQRRFKTGPRP